MEMTKLVNIYPAMPVITVNPPIRGITRRVKKPVSVIRECIMARATVEEILADNSTVNLDLSNYDKDNSVHTCEDEPVKVPEKNPMAIDDPKKDAAIIQDNSIAADKESSPEVPEQASVEAEESDEAILEDLTVEEESKEEETSSKNDLDKTLDNLKNKYKNKHRK